MRRRPGTFAENGSDQLDRHRRRLSAADAEAGDAARLAVALERGDQRRDDARATGADRVTERGRAAVHVLFHIVIKFFP